MADDGKKDVTVSVSYKIMKEVPAPTQKFLDDIPKLKKAFETKFEFSEKAELDPSKNPKKEVEEHLEQAARYPFQLLSTRLGDVVKKAGKGLNDKDKAEVEKRFLKELEQARKDATSNCKKKLEEIVSGKGDNAKALKDGKAAFAKLENVDFKNAFDQPQEDITKALKKLAKTLEAGENADALDDAKGEVEGASDAFEKDGKAAIKAISFLLTTARKIAADRKADTELKNFGKLVLKDKAPLEAFEKNSDDFAKAIDKAVDALGAKKMDAATAKKLSDDFGKMTKLGEAASKVVKIAEELKPKFAAIEKKLKA